MDNENGKERRKFLNYPYTFIKGLKGNDFDDLYDLVVLKDRIAEYLWYMLTGALVIQNSHSYIMSIKCNRSASELEGKLANIMNNPKKKKKPQKWALGY